ncbi:MAG: hypothetical protein ACPGU4_11305 [Flavobacteriales bacterium]
MDNNGLLEEIMTEVESLNKSIAELCPELISTSLLPSIKEQSDDISHLIEHRIELLKEHSAEEKSEKSN